MDDSVQGPCLCMMQDCVMKKLLQKYQKKGLLCGVHDEGFHVLFD